MGFRREGREYEEGRWVVSLDLLSMWSSLTLMNDDGVDVIFVIGTTLALDIISSLPTYNHSISISEYTVVTIYHLYSGASVPRVVVPKVSWTIYIEVMYN